MNKYIIKVNGNPYEVEIVVPEDGGTNSDVATTTTMTKTVTPQTVRLAKPQGNNNGDVTAPMPGTVLNVKVAVGDSVQKGQILLILEAMKMENEILSPVDGKVALIKVEANKAVTRGEVLLSIA